MWKSLLCFKSLQGKCSTLCLKPVFLPVAWHTMSLMLFYLIDAPGIDIYVHVPGIMFVLNALSCENDTRVYVCLLLERVSNWQINIFFSV